jgi:hypothetical protein
MSQPDSGDAPDSRDFPGLQRQVRELESRVARLEERFAPRFVPTTVAAPDLDAAISGTAGAIPALGRSLLGLAGAFLLRAITESKVVSPAIGVGVGILYALLWLLWAARAPATRRAEAALRSLTAALILAPLLWEAALHFQAIPNWIIAAVAVLFTTFGLLVSWRGELHVVALIAVVAGLGTASALLLATHDVAPFLVALLALAALVEVSACLGHWMELRWMAALAGDLVVTLAAYVLARPGGLPEGYPTLARAVVIAALLALPAIYLTSIAVRTLLRGCAITWFEIAQAAVALVIGTVGGLGLSQDPRVSISIGGLLGLLAVAAYVAAFLIIARRESQSRTFHAISILGFALAIASLALMLPVPRASIPWAILAVTCIVIGSKSNRAAWLWHGAAFLLAASWASGVIEESAAVLLSSSTGVPSRGMAECISGAAALLCLLLVVRRPQPALPAIIASLLSWQFAGVAAGFLTGTHHALFGIDASHAYCATIRTGVLAIGAVVLAWVGARWRAELSWLLYPMMALGAYRLVAEDLHQDRRAALILSLVLYGAALMILPRIVPRHRPTHSP